MAQARSMILDMLKTPQQVREEQQRRITEQALGMQSQIPRGTTAIPGLITNLANQQMVRTAQGMAEMPRRLAGAGGMIAGALGASPEVQQGIRNVGLTGAEIQAQRVQEAAQGLDLGNVESMKQALKRMQEAGAPLEATLALSEAIAKRQKELLDRASAARGEQLQRDLFGLKERQIELDEAKFDAEQLLGGALGDFDLNTEEGLNDAVETLMAQGKVAEAVRLKNAYKKQQSTLEQRVTYLAENFTNGDLQAAYDMALEEKRTEPLLGDTAKRLDADFDKANATVSRLNTANDALRILASGDVNIGALPKTRQGALKLLEQALGLDTDQSVERTELLMARVKKLGGEALASGMFGSGTAISDRDLITAMSIAGGDENLTPAGMEAILRANMAIDMHQLEKYNKRVNSLGQGFWDRSFYSKDSYMLQAPEIFIPSFSVERAESAASDGQGNTIYEYRGEWYNADGTRYEP